MLRTRIAPTPSGFLHIGNLFSFVLTWLIAQKKSGIVFLRIDDLDIGRVRPEYLEDIFQLLDFIGLEPDEGPSGVNEFLERYSQRHRMPLYIEKKEILQKQQLLFACDCSRSFLEKYGTGNRYPGICLNKNLPFSPIKNTLRITLTPENEWGYYDDYTRKKRSFNLQKTLGEFVVWRKDGWPAYHLASVADDDYFGINYIVRGEDLALSSAAQLYLAEKVGISSFKIMGWLHHPLLLNEEGAKLSKSAGAKAVSGLISQGLSRKGIIRQIASGMQLPDKPYETLKDLNDCFANDSLEHFIGFG